MLEIQNLRVAAHDTTILHGLDLSVGAGEVHAIMGPNGSGKSTLVQALAGHPGYAVLGGTATLDGADLLALAPEERARRGLFLAFQYPVEIPGLGNGYFLKAAVNAVREARGQQPYDAVDFLKIFRRLAPLVGLGPDFLERGVNAGFSGGEKKRNEILQMLLLEPRLALLDETDSGLDVDALKMVAQGINATRDRNRSIVLVTHYQRLLDYVEPDFVHILVKGRIVRSGNAALAEEIEKTGYEPMLAATT
jgi:Fe-S cluster assembly ATP-binding protein